MDAEKITGESSTEKAQASKNEFVFTKESLKKKFRLSEYLSETIISGIAYLSIAVIALIFLFVFRESLPIFTGKPEKKWETATTSAPERYGEEPSAAAQPERYGVEPETQVEIKPERYGTDEPAAPERYGVEPDESISEEEKRNAFVQDSILSGVPITLNLRLF